MPIKTQSAKAKGRNHQKAVKALLEEEFEWEEGDCESRSMGSGGVDLMFSPKARKDFPWSIECKKRKKFPTPKDMEQANYNAYPETEGMVAYSPHGTSKIYFVVEGKTFIKHWKKHCQN